MISRIRAWWLHKIAKNREQQFQRGFDYAAGQLLLHRNDVMEQRRIRIEAIGVDIEPAHPFNYGMQAAIGAFDRVTDYRYDPDFEA
jgi:hypothetical protein